MEIDLNDIPIGVAENQRELNILKSAKIYRELKSVKSDFNYLIVSLSVLNILEHHQYFCPVSNSSQDTIYYVGDFMNMRVYIDLLLHPEQIVLSYDKSILRNSKLESILDGKSEVKEELVISVYY